MSYRITVQQGLAAHFMQPTGVSLPGIDWMIQIEGPRRGRVIVRSYLKGRVATEEEKAVLAQRAIDLVTRKIESGWDPSVRAGVLDLPDI
jgi:hypothetical protein